MDSRVAFVRSLELPEWNDAEPGSSTGAYLELSDGKEAGYVDGGSLVSFASALKGQQKEDVLNSTLLAQLAANKAHDRYKETDQWYKFYANVMEKVGWVVQGFRFDRYKSHAESFKMSEAVLAILITLVGGEAEVVAVVKATLEGLKNSAKDTDLFASNSCTSESGTFQIIPCSVDENSQVNVAFVGAYFKASQVSTNFLFFTMNSRDIQLFKTAQVFTLDEEMYGEVREEVKKKLGKAAKTFIDDLHI